MRFLESIRFRLAAIFRRSEVHVDMDEELRSHIQLRADDLEREGMTRAEAERKAKIEFGAYERVTEECREATGGIPGEIWFRDLAYSIRVLRKSPAFTMVAVLTLAFAIGANAIVFSVLNGLILRPLNIPEAGRVFQIEHGTDDSSNQSYPNYADLRDRTTSFEGGVMAYAITAVALDTGNNPQKAWTPLVTGNYFDALRIQPYLGRLFHPSDERGPNSAPYVVLSYQYWKNHFQEDRNVIGRVVQVNKNPYTIIGVTPPEFHGTLLFFSPDIYTPIVNEEQLEGEAYLNARAPRRVFSVMGRLKPGVNEAQAIQDLNTVGAYLEKTYPNDASQMTFKLSRPNLYGNFMGRPVKGFVAGLMLLSGLILLAACANLGSLFAARASDRSRDVALRLALGASRTRVLRQIFTEAMIISLIGGAIGLVGSIYLLGALSAWQPLPRFPISIPVMPDGKVYIVALLLALASGFLFGLVPVKQILETSPYEIVKSGARSTHGGRFNLRDALVVVQIAICAVLVTASMVAVRGLVRSLHSEVGFNPKNAVLVDADLAMAGYKDATAIPMQKKMLEAAQALPGVASASLVDWPPLDQAWQTALVFKEETTDLKPVNAAATSMWFQISPEYFQTAGTSMLMGRAFTWHDDEKAPPVAVVNREFAKRLFGSQAAALGSYFKRRNGDRVQIVGIVEDGKYQSLTESPKPALFMPFMQSTRAATWLVIRSERDPQQVGTDIRTAVRKLDPGIPLFVTTWEKDLDGAMFASRVATLALGVLGVMGGMLSLTGIFGMAAYSVSKRMKELGIRVALGAQKPEVLKAALGRAFKLLAYGSAAGLILGLLATKVLAYVVYQATPKDPIVLFGSVLAMCLLGALATWIPARRALSVDPLILLREE